MKRNEAFPPAFLTQADCDPPVRVVLDTVTEEQMQGDKDEMKPVAHFSHADRSNFPLNRGLVMNVTNWELMFEVAGKDPALTDTDEIKGTVLELYVDSTIKYAGKRVGGIRIRKPRKAPESPAQDESIPF